MKELKIKIEYELRTLNELYDYYLQKSEDIDYIDNWGIIEKRLHDLKIEINTYKKVLEMVNNG